MAIRRRTTTTVVDEIDDSVDRLSPTPFPPQLEGHLLSDAERGTPIGSPDPTDGEGLDSGLSHDSNTTPPTIGRTFSDLIIESKNDYRIMVVVITAVSFIIFMVTIPSRHVKEGVASHAFESQGIGSLVRCPIMPQYLFHR